MKTQNYSNYKKFYAPHHFIFLPATFLLMIFGVYKYFSAEENEKLPWILFAACMFFLLFLAMMLRQHYALGNQNRIVRLEFKQRYFELFGKRSDEVENKLNFGQISALRFAYDDEFKILLDKALTQNLQGEEIKKSIKNWRPDNHRV